MSTSTMPGSTKQPPPSTGLDDLKCPACGSVRVASPSAFDPYGLWRCLDCGAAWKSPVEAEPVARRHMANPLFPWPPKEML
jgi:DNA-directed RNA polymerase subunit RPC12/RpoP